MDSVPPPTLPSLPRLTRPCLLCSPSHAKSRFCHSRDYPPPTLSPGGERGKWKSGGCLDSVKQNAHQVNTHSCQLMQRCVWVLSLFLCQSLLFDRSKKTRFMMKICIMQENEHLLRIMFLHKQCLKPLLSPNSILGEL